MAPIAVRLRHHPRAAHSRLRMLRAQRQAVQQVHRGLHHPNCLQMERSFNSLLAGTRDRQSHPVTRIQMDNLRDQQQHIAVLKQVASQPQNQPRPVSAPPVAEKPLSPYPGRRPSDKGSKSQVQAENANDPRKSSDSETDNRTFKKSPCRRIGPLSSQRIGQVLHAHIR